MWSPCCNTIFHTKIFIVMQTDHQITEVCSENVVTESKVQKWCQEFSHNCTNIYDENRSDWPSLVNDELTQYVVGKIRINRCFTISELSDNFPEVSWTTLCKIIIEKLHYDKLCARWVPKMLTEVYKTQRMSKGRKFLVHYCAEGDKYNKRTVTGDETIILCMNVEIKQQSMQWKHSS